MHELYEVSEGPPWLKDEERMTRIVVIGRRLRQPGLLASLIAAASTAP